MTIRNILVPMPHEKSGRVALRAALAVGQAFDAHVAALHVKMDPQTPIPYVAGPMPTELLVQISENAEEHANQLAKKVRDVWKELCDSEGVKVVDSPQPKGVCATWGEAVGSRDYRYGLEGRLHDLTVVAQPDPDDRDSTADILEGVLFHSTRPVLMVPEKTSVKSDGKVIIAWNGGIEATRAVRGALPFLAQAETVVILTVDGGRDLDGPDATALAESLSWRGINADIVETKPAGKSDGETVLKATQDLKADMLVMGAYSHSRLRELILGGVTQEVIEDCKIPVLMTH